MSIAANHRTVPQIVFLRLLEACNASCPMCPYAKSRDPFRFSGDELCALADDLSDVGVEELRFTGGEPALHEEITSYIAYASGTGLRVSLITNGSLLPKRAREFAAAGLDTLYCSLDGVSAAQHDVWRGIPGLLRNALRGLEAVKEEAERIGRKMSIVVNTVVSRLNVAELPAFVSLLEDAGVDKWALIPLKGTPEWQMAPSDEQAVIDSLRSVRAAAACSKVTLLCDTDDVARYTIMAMRGETPPQRECVIPMLYAYIDAKNRTINACNALAHTEPNPLRMPWPVGRRFSDVWMAESYVEKRFAHASGACTCSEPANALVSRQWPAGALHRSHP
jgi:cytosylglucuronate decarboxylase